MLLLQKCCSTLPLVTTNFYGLWREDSKFQIIKEWNYNTDPFSLLLNLGCQIRGSQNKQPHNVYVIKISTLHDIPFSRIAELYSFPVWTPNKSYTHDPARPRRHREMKIPRNGIFNVENKMLNSFRERKKLNNFFLFIYTVLERKWAMCWKLP